MMKDLKDFYDEKNKESFPFIINLFSKPKFQHPLDKEERESLQSHMKLIYNPRIKKLKKLIISGMS